MRDAASIAAASCSPLQNHLESEGTMEQILLGVGMMVTGMVVMLSASGVSGGPKARRARLAALGRWPAILVMGVAIGLLIAGFLEILLWVEDHNTKPVLSRDVFLVVTSLGI